MYKEHPYSDTAYLVEEGNSLKIERGLQNTLRKTFHMIKEDAVATAHVVISAFGGDEEVNDADLTREVRSLFYILEHEKLLDVRRTGYELDGKTRRAYFWRLRHVKFPDEPIAPIPSNEEIETATIYNQLPSEQWMRNQVA